MHTRLIENTTPGTTWRERALWKYYYGRPQWKDGTTQFWQYIQQSICHGSSILEVGAGPTNKTTEFLSRLGRVTGLDIDPAVRTNEHCSNAVVYDGTHIPFDTDSCDFVVSDFVCEHLKDPPALTREIHRVLRPLGRFVFRTPNLWHYVSLVAKLTPQWFHCCVANRARALSDNSHRPYQTYHRMNTRRACLKILTNAGFKIESMKLIEPEPSYGLVSPLAFYPLMAWERILNSTSALEVLRANILCVARADKQQ